MCKELNVGCTSEGNHSEGEIKSAVWQENYKDIATLLDGESKVEHIKIEEKKETGII